MDPELLKTRADRLRLQRKRIAELAGLDETTVGRALNGRKDSLRSTLQAIDRVIAAEEVALKKYLSGAAA